MFLFVPPKQYLLLLWFCLLNAFTVQHKSKEPWQDIWSTGCNVTFIVKLIILTAHAWFWVCASQWDGQLFTAIIETSHSRGLILCGKSYAPMHIRGGAFCYVCVCVCVRVCVRVCVKGTIDVEVEAEWALLEAPVAWTCCLYSALVLRQLSLI